MAEIVALAQEYPILAGIYGATLSGNLALLDYDNRRERRRQKNWVRPFDNFYTTRRSVTLANKKNVYTNKMPVFTQGRKRAAGRAYQNPNPNNRKRMRRGTVARRVIPRQPSLATQRGVVWANLQHFQKIEVESFAVDVGGGQTQTVSDTMAGMVTPLDLLKCGRLQVYLHNYEFIKVHRFSVEWITTHPTYIMSMYDSAGRELGTGEKLESYYERQPTLRIHRSDRNGRRGVISRTESLGLKLAFKDYIRSSTLAAHLAADASKCSIKYIAPNQRDDDHQMTAIIKFTISAYGMKDSALEAEDSQLQVAAIE